MKSKIEIEKKYREWVDNACDYVDEVGSHLNMPVGAMQSDISMVLGNEINIMFLGHDAHEVNRDFIFENSDYFRYRCLNGNPYWGNRNEKGWPIWKNLRDSFIKVFGESTLMDDMDHLVFTNAIFFTGDNIDEVLNQINKTDTSVESKCMELTRDLIFDILQPKLLVCFSVSDVFDKLIHSIRRKDGFNEKLSIKKFKPFHIKHTCAITQFNGTTILGIPHPSGAHGVLASLPAIVRIISDLAKEVEIEKIVATKELFLDSHEVWNNKVEEAQLESRANQLKTKISKNGTNQWIDFDGSLIHEYYCKDKRGNYKKGNGTISIRLKIDDEKGKFVISTISDGNHPEDFRNLICEYCGEKGWAKSDSEFSFSKDVSTNDDIIVEFMTSLLEEMKAYRQNDTKE